MSNNDSLNFCGFMKTEFVSSNSLVPGIENFVLPSEMNCEEGQDVDSSLMLGKRAEKYFSSWISASVEYRMLLENIQVFNDRITLGEFDFFVKRLADNQIIHIELVYKFYLLDPSVEGALKKWVGPNRNDSLALKIDKLRNKQFPLLSSPEGESTLSSHLVDCQSIEQQLAFFCNLFVPIFSEKSDVELNSKAIEGYWYTFDEFISSHSEEDKYFMPRKQDWFIRELPSVEWCSQNEIQEQLKFSLENGKSPMLWKLNKKGLFERLFVVWWKNSIQNTP